MTITCFFAARGRNQRPTPFVVAELRSRVEDLGVDLIIRPRETLATMYVGLGYEYEDCHDDESGNGTQADAYHDAGRHS